MANLTLKDNYEQIAMQCANLIDELLDYEAFDFFWNKSRTFSGASMMKLDYCFEECFLNQYGNVTMSGGATRLTIISDEMDYVVKICFEEVASDYVTDEYLIYNDVKNSEEFQDLLPMLVETSRFLYDGSWVEIQEKVDADEDLVYQTYGDYLDNSEVEEVLEDTYGEKIYDMFEEFGINDLHCGNLGFRDGKPVLFDFAGYHE